jgi:predicted dehydrogenase
MSTKHALQPSRREVLLGAAALTASTALGVHAQDRSSAKPLAAGDKLNIGLIGAGGRATDNIRFVEQHNIVALCDVDAERATIFRRYPDAKKYKDFRKMLDEQKGLDAVVVSTPDHIHAIAAITAMKAGKHVYCEKPLAHSIYEVRRMRDVAAEMKVATQMGTQGHAFEGTRQAVEAIRAGAIGEVTQLHVWSDRPANWWPQGVGRPKETPPVPESLDWDLWLGPAPYRPYHPQYVPFKWRGVWDFGTGAIGDMGVHNLDTAFWALELGLPETAEVKDAEGVNPETGPTWCILEIDFPARGPGKPPVKLTWYDGGKQPPAELFQGEKIPTNGSLAIGKDGTLFTRDWHGGMVRNDWHLLLPKSRFADYKRPPKTLPRVENHYEEWLAACRGGPAPLSNFGYASVLTESLLLGNLALRVGKKIEWDAANMKAKNCPEADAFIRPQFRAGWTV